MIKAKELLECLCTDYSYRFFAGKSVKALDKLVANMTKDLLHYTPTVSTKNAVGLSLGVNLTGFNSVVMLEIKDLALIYNYIKDLKVKYEQPLLFLVGYSSEDELLEYKKLINKTKSFVADDTYKNQFSKNKKGVRLVFVQEGILE